jgi:hypothetical protein
MKYVSRMMLWLATLGLIVPQAGLVSAAQPGAALPSHSAVADVALDSSNLLRGQLVDRQGAGKADCQIRLLSASEVVATTVTDKQGVFQLPLERGGVYTLDDGQSMAVFRVWTRQAAPPSAKEAVLIVSDPDLTRARLGRGGLNSLLGWAAIIGVAAAVIWAVTKDDDDGS